MAEIQKGFYYHYKHNPNGELSNYAYEVMGMGIHSETTEPFVVYRSLYESADGKGGAQNLWLRPHSMFIENVVKDGKEMKRFTKITDLKVISELETIKHKMYD
ncbi:MAG: DUF1653 domain-containing protein [Candidatus Pacebacteria bacterium]|jgi:hypothetical protein|nr:DUF1653 domain-containing protein [Candidatus Paceibacterota bacterium]